MSAPAAGLQEAAIQQQCKLLRMPAVAAQCVRLAEQAVRERQNHLGYLEALLAGCRVPLPGDGRASGESGSDPDHQSSFLGMDPVIPNARLCKALLDRVI